jgi:hypothetical protein
MLSASLPSPSVFLLHQGGTGLARAKGQPVLRGLLSAPATGDERDSERTVDDLVLGRYRLLRRLGEGGMGVVWLAQDTRLHRPVAVKRITGGAEAGGRKRAGREAVAAARLAHPAIVALYEAGQDGDGDWILVCELVRGATLQALLRDGALSDRDVAEIGIALCEALEHAHGRGVVHRDIKPANIICPDAVDEAGAVAKLTDFGVARLAGDETLTRTGDVLGTLAYMAPEQARGRAAGPPADVYALGIVLYEAFAGVNPRRGGHAAETARLVDAEVPPLGRLRRDLPESLTDAIDRACAVDPRQRPKPSVLRTALKRALPELEDEPGLVTGGPLEAVTHALRAGTRFARDVTQVAAGRWHPEPPPAPLVADATLAAPGPAPASSRAPARVAAAGLAGLGAAAALAWAQPPGVPVPALLAAGAAVLVLLLPRLGWLATAAGVVAAVAMRDAGAAVLLAAMLAPVPVLLPRAGTAWSVPALAPLLGAASLAGAFPALAGQAARPTVRAGLGALGAWWVLLSAAPLESAAHLGSAPASWPASAAAATDVLGDVLSSGAVALVLVWALAALLLPVLVRGWNAAADIAAAAGWAAGTAAATDALATALALPAPRGLVAGAVVAGVLAVAARAVADPVR